jgi:hypothetical protein
MYVLQLLQALQLLPVSVRIVVAEPISKTCLLVVCLKSHSVLYCKAMKQKHTLSGDLICGMV